MNLKTREEQGEALRAIDELITRRYQTKKRARQVSAPVLADLKKQVAALPAISLTLAFTPGQETLNRISAWLKTNVAKDLLIDLMVDENIIGGAQIAYQGHYKDYSLAKKLKKI